MAPFFTSSQINSAPMDLHSLIQQTNSTSNESSTDSDSSILTDFLFTDEPIEALLDKDVSDMDVVQLRAHIAKLRALSTNPTNITRALKEESEVLTKKTSKKKPKIDLNSLLQ